VKTFLGDLRSSHKDYTHTLSTSIPKFDFSSISTDYSKARKRLFFLDDDGTLRTPEFTQRIAVEPPEESRMRALLTELCQDPRNDVYLMSSRTREGLESLLNIPKLGIW
jgi:trehalose 6-phosphate synthase/phosphatase